MKRGDTMGADPATIGAGAAMAGGQAAGQLGGSLIQAYAQEKAADEAGKKALTMSREQLAEQQRQFNVNNEAFESAKNTGENQFGTGEKDFLTAVNTASPELAQMEADIKAGTTQSMGEARGQIGAALAQQGVRGGQAAANMARQLGTMGIQEQRDINTMKGNEALQRQAELRAYMASKAKTGQTATLSGVAR